MSPHEKNCPPLPRLEASSWLRRRENFYESRLGPLREPSVYHWNEPTDPHVDVYALGTTPAPTLITGGAADRPQPRIRAGEFARRIELLMCVAEIEPWAASALRSIALVPFVHDMVLGPGSLIRGTGPVRPGAALHHAFLVSEPATTGLGGFVVEGEEVVFLRVLFIAEAEFDLGVAAGPEVLVRALGPAAKVVDPSRAPVV